MRNIKYFFSLLIILTMSIFFVSISYSKESTNINQNKLAINEDNLSITTSLGTNFVSDSVTTNNLSIINHNGETISYNIILKAYNNQDDIYVSIDSNTSTKYVDEIIYEDTIDSYGTEGDYKYHELTINAPKGTHFKLDVVKKKEYNLNKIIIKNSKVYKENNNYRYYGENVNNYLTYNNNLYRIIGIIDNEVRLISEKDSSSIYNDSLNYLSIDDYLKSFNETNITLDNSNNYASWLKNEEPYWLETPIDYYNAYSYYSNSGIILTNRNNIYANRAIIKVDPNLLIVKGNGTVDNPYEVSYES